ncbi:AP-1 complex subunit gamma-2 [Pycnococcus provasolii]
MSQRLAEFIRGVRACRTAAEERALVAREAAALRTAFKEQDNAHRHRNVAKLMFMHMLGYPTHFGQMECLKLIAEESFADKRVGYLSLSLLLDERQEVLMLVTNSMKSDLTSKNHFVVGLSLCALGGVGSPEMCRDLASEVCRLLNSQSSYVRKKACLASVRIVKKAPDVTEQFLGAVPSLLNDRHHGVLIAGAQLALELCACEPKEYVPRIRKEVPTICRILNSLMGTGFASEHDVDGIPDPFLQVALLRLLRVLGEDDAEASEQMSDLLASVVSNTQGTGGGMKQAAYSILYECVRTIMSIKAASGLRVLAINTLGKFLGNRDNNIRYVSLSLLAQCVRVDIQAVQRHRSVVVECVKDADMSIRRRALELVYALVNETNASTLTKELLDYLHVADVEFKADLVEKLCQLVSMYAPSVAFYVDTVTEVMVEAGEHIKENAVRSLLAAVSASGDDSVYRHSCQALFTACWECYFGENRKTRTPGSLACATCWVLGEYGDVLDIGVVQASAKDFAAGGQVTASAAVALIEHIVENGRECSGALGFFASHYAITALAKLASRANLEGSLRGRVEAVLAKTKGSSILEVQARSVEFSELFRFNVARKAAFERMPAMEVANMATAPLEEVSVASADGGAAAVADLLGGADLLGDAGNGVGPAAPAAAIGGGADLLGDLLGGGGGDIGGMTAPASAPAAAPVDPLAALMGDSAPPPTATGLGGLLGSEFSAAPQMPVAMQPAASAMVKAFDKDGVSVTMNFSKAADGSVTVAASFGNATPSDLNSFALQVAVPKGITLEMRPASSSSIPAGSSGAVTQTMRLQREVMRPLALRIRVSYTVASTGAAVQEMSQVDASMLPAGL